MREFNQAFQFVQTKAEKVSADDDAIDSNLKKVLLDLMDDQRKQVQRAWLSNKAGDNGLRIEVDEGSFQDFIDLLSDVELNELLRLIMPIVKLEPGKYLIGTKVRQIQQKGNNLLARVGGGYEDLGQAISSESKIHCLQIALLMEKKGQSYKDTMVEILTQKKAPEKVIRAFMRDKVNDQIPFQPILNAIKAREGKNWEQRKIRERVDAKMSAELGSAMGSQPSTPMRNSNGKLINFGLRRPLSFVMSEKDGGAIEADGPESPARIIKRLKSASFIDTN